MKLSSTWILATALLTGLSARGQNDGSMDITVRSGVDGAEQKKRDRDPAYDRDRTKQARLFFLARVQEEKNGERLVKPVDANAIARALTRELEAHGFRAVRPPEKPEIVITVKYGRGALSNPYSDNAAAHQHTSLSNTDVIAVWPSHKKFIGLAERAERAKYEKLILQVRAWAYPPPADPKKKEKLLWMTTMYVDDPDHRDLNEIADKLLARGAPYFDRHIGREDEVVINTALPEGHVKVGSPEVIKDKPAK